MSATILTQSQKDKFAAWLNERATLIGKCTLCGERRWIIIDELLEVRPFTGGGLTVGGSLYPFVGVACQNCGNTQFVSAILSGVIESGTPATPSKARDQDE